MFFFSSSLEGPATPSRLVGQWIGTIHDIMTSTPFWACVQVARKRKPHEQARCHGSKGRVSIIRWTFFFFSHASRYACCTFATRLSLCRKCVETDSRTHHS